MILHEKVCCAHVKPKISKKQVLDLIQQIWLGFRTGHVMLICSGHHILWCTLF